MQRQLDVSERRTCGVLGQPRSTQRYRPQVAGDEGRLVKRLHELARAHPRHGYRMMTAHLRGEGWRVNGKRVYRLWRREGLKVVQKQHKKRRLGDSEGGVVRRAATHKNHVWAWDFIHDRTEDGRALKWLSVVDEYTRECLALEVDRSSLGYVPPAAFAASLADPPVGAAPLPLDLPAQSTPILSQRVVQKT